MIHILVKILILILFLLILYYYKLKNNIENFDNNNSYDKIDIIYYINLEERKDRNEHFINEMNKMNIPNYKIKRIDAIRHENGALGCSMSHIKTLKEFIKSSHNNCIIFEDDFLFTVSKDELINQLNNLFINNIDFDVVSLAGYYDSIENTNYNFIKKVKGITTTSGYIITKKFAVNILLDNFIIGAYLLENNPNLGHLYRIDEYWKILQNNNNFYIFEPKIGKQSESYSDIRKQITNYEFFTPIYNIFTWWTGANELTENRRKSLECLKNISECNITFITKDILDNYILPEYPLHEGYKYLSETQKGDYLKVYFMNFYGGGYTDIKCTTSSWKNSFNELYNSDYWICGYKEIEGGVAYTPLIDKYNELIGNGAYICKLNTPLTNEWYNEVIMLMDAKLQQLKLNPAKHPTDHKEINSLYLFEWNELNGRIFHKICYKYKDKLLNTLPIPIFTDYR